MINLAQKYEYFEPHSHIKGADVRVRVTAGGIIKYMRENWKPPKTSDKTIDDITDNELLDYFIVVHWASKLY